MNSQRRTSPTARSNREHSRRTSPALESANWRSLRPSQDNAGNTPWRVQPPNGSGNTLADNQQLKKVGTENLSRGQILWLPSRREIRGSKYTNNEEAWDGVYDHPVLVRQIWEDPAQQVILELQPLTSFGGRPINEKYQEDDKKALKDRRRAMLIEHSKNKSGRDAGKWDNSDCPEKLQFQRGETPCPSYVRLDKVLFLELENVRSLPQASHGCSITMASLEIVMIKAPTPMDHDLSLRKTPSSNQVSLADLQKIMKKHTEKRRSAPDVSLQLRPNEMKSLRKTKSMERLLPLIMPQQKGTVEQSLASSDVDLVTKVSEMELYNPKALPETEQEPSRRGLSSKVNRGTPFPGPMCRLSMTKAVTTSLKV